MIVKKLNLSSVLVGIIFGVIVGGTVGCFLNRNGRYTPMKMNNGGLMILDTKKGIFYYLTSEIDEVVKIDMLRPKMEFNKFKNIDEKKETVRLSDSLSVE